MFWGWKLEKNEIQKGSRNGAGNWNNMRLSRILATQGLRRPCTVRDACGEGERDADGGGGDEQRGAGWGGVRRGGGEARAPWRRHTVWLRDDPGHAP